MDPAAGCGDESSYIGAMASITIGANTWHFSEAWKRAFQTLAVSKLRERYPDLKLESFSDIAIVADMLEDAGDDRCEDLREAHATNGTSEAFRSIKVKALQVDGKALVEGLRQVAAAMASFQQVLAAKSSDGRSTRSGRTTKWSQRRQRRRNPRRDPASHNAAATPAFLKKSPPKAASRRRGSARGR